MKNIKTVNNQDQTWTVFNPNNMTTATIVQTQYRIDFQGKTIASMIENFQTAKNIARKHLLAI